MAKKKKDTIELDEQNIFMRIPRNTLMTVVQCVVVVNGKEQKVEKTMLLDDINKAREDFLEYVEDGDDYDARYVLTDKGKELLRSLSNEEE